MPIYDDATQYEVSKTSDMIFVLTKVFGRKFFIGFGYAL